MHGIRFVVLVTVAVVVVRSDDILNCSRLVDIWICVHVDGTIKFECIVYYVMVLW